MTYILPDGSIERLVDDDRTEVSHAVWPRVVFVLAVAYGVSLMLTFAGLSG
jgi:hypothetical protein